MEGLPAARWRILEFPRIDDTRGRLTVVEGERHVPFSIRRVFYIYDVPAGARRGGHAHKTLEQVLVCLTGRLVVTLDDGQQTGAVTLDRPWIGLYVPPLIWMSQAEFWPGTVYMVLASDVYDETDYYRDYEVFRAAVTVSRA